MKNDELEFVLVLGRLGRTDREGYRQLRQEAWDLIQENHTQKSAEERLIWCRNAS